MYTFPWLFYSETKLGVHACVCSNIEAHRHGHHQLLISPSKGEEASCVLLFYLFQMSVVCIGVQSVICI